MNKEWSSVLSILARLLCGATWRMCTPRWRCRWWRRLPGPTSTCSLICSRVAGSCSHWPGWDSLWVGPPAVYRSHVAQSFTYFYWKTYQKKVRISSLSHLSLCLFRQLFYSVLYGVLSPVVESIHQDLLWSTLRLILAMTDLRYVR